MGWEIRQSDSTSYILKKGMVYLINFILVPVYYLFIKTLFRNKKKVGNIFFLVAIVHAVLFRALANPYVYVDTEWYAQAYTDIAAMSFKDAVLSTNFYTSWGRGYLAFNWLLAQISKETSLLFIILSIVSVSGTMLYYKKVAAVPLLAVLIYLYYPMMYTMGFGVVRQHFAVVFLLWALFYADNLKVSIPLAIWGVLCHTGSIIFLPYYFLKYLNLNKLSSIKWLALTVVGVGLITYSVSFFISFTERYEDVYKYGENQNNIVPVIMIGSMLLVCFVLGVFRRVKDDHDRHVLRFLLYGLIVAIFSMGTPGAGRLTLPFIYALPVAICLPFKYSKDKSREIALAYTIAVFVFVTILVYKAIDKYDIYKFFWEYA